MYDLIVTAQFPFFFSLHPWVQHKCKNKPARIMATSGSWDSLGGRHMANLALVLRAEQWHQWGRSSIHPPHQHPDSFKGLDADSSAPAYLTSFEDKDRPAWLEFLAGPCNSKMLGWFSMGRLGTSGAIAFGGSPCRSGRKTYMFAIMTNRIEDLTCHRWKKVNAEITILYPIRSIVDLLFQSCWWMWTI